MDLAEELQERYDATLRAELAAPETSPLPEGFPRPRLPASLRESIVAAAELADPSPLAEFYCERMPRMLVEQILRGEDPARRLLWMELDPERTPRLTAALRGIASSRAAEGLRPLPVLHDLLERRTCAARLAAGTLLGSGLPLVGAYPADREAFARDLESGVEPQDLLDLRLSGNIAHEICHGPRRASAGPPAPWLLVEAAAIHLGSAAFPRHVVPRIAGEAIPGVALFAVVGEALARLFGRNALWRLAFGEPIEGAFGEAAGRALAAAGWQDWMRRPEPPFARDASRFAAWVKLADATRGSCPLEPLIARAAASPDPARSARDLPDLLSAAEALPWAELPWWREAPTDADAQMARAAVAGMFRIDVLEEAFRTHPHQPARLHLDAEAGLLWRDSDARGVGVGEPARFIVPPPFCRRLRERGWRRCSIDGSAHAELLACILEARPWTSSPS